MNLKYLMWSACLFIGTLHASNVPFERPDLGFTPESLQQGQVALEFGLPDVSWPGPSRDFNVLAHVGLGYGMEAQVSSDESDPHHRVSLKWSGNNTGVMLTTGTQTYVAATHSFTNSHWAFQPTIQIGSGYEIIMNVAYQYGPFSPYIEYDHTADDINGHGDILGAGITYAILSNLQIDVYERTGFSGDVDSAESGAGISYAF